MAKSRTRCSALGACRISSTILQVPLANSLPITGVTMIGSKLSREPELCWRFVGCMVVVWTVMLQVYVHSACCCLDCSSSSYLLSYLCTGDQHMTLINNVYTSISSTSNDAMPSDKASEASAFGVRHPVDMRLRASPFLSPNAEMHLFGYRQGVSNLRLRSMYRTIEIPSVIYKREDVYSTKRATQVT